MHKEHSVSPSGRILGLFEKRIPGDDALLQLAQARFRRAGLGAELYAGNPEELERLFRFLPSGEALVTVHLPRGINLLDEGSRRFVIGFARKFGSRVYGLTVHDQPEIRLRFEEYLAALENLDSGLEEIPGEPLLFVEYAASLHPDRYVRIFREAERLDHISACIDTGHLGLRLVRDEYFGKHPGEDLLALAQTEALRDRMQDLKEAVRLAKPAVIQVIREIGRLGKPLHFHLHDGHPLSVASEFGVSDHLSFLARIPIPFEYEGRRSLPPMFGPEGLKDFVAESSSLLGLERVSYSLEIHPTGDRLPLAEEDRPLFRHWPDKTNAEKMNYWLSVLKENQGLILEMRF